MATITTTTTSFCHRPISQKPLSRTPTPKPAKPISVHKLSARNSGFFTGGLKSMTELVKPSTFKTSRRGNEETEVEAFVDGSTDFTAVDGRFDFEASLNRASKWIVSILFAAVILWKHDAEALWAAMGSVVNAILSVVLKRILNQERPDSIVGSGPGMPSSHAQSIFYTSMFVILSTIESLGMNAFTLISSALVLAFGSYLAWLRVSQKLHTIPQIAVGAVVGSLFSIFWLWSWDAFVFDAFASSLLVRILVIVGALGFCGGFVLYVIRDWLNDD